MKINSWAIFRSILFDLGQKLCYLASFDRINSFCPLILWGQQWDLSPVPFWPFSPFASARPLGRVPKCLSAEKSIMENKSIFVSIIIKRRQIAHFARLERIFSNPSRTPSLELMCESYDDFGEAVEI
jgi:hypothetical protein